MRAVEVTRFGGPEVLSVSELPDPVAGTGQVMIAVEFADTLFMDTQLRSGAWQEFMPLRPPSVPGDGIAGAVASTGPDVDPSWVGQRVVALTHGVGAYAELVIADLDQVVAVPDELDLQTAAALVHDGRTACALVEGTGVRAGESILVLAAGGGLGLLLVQLARAAGARVIGAARGTRKLEAVRSHGAEVVVNYGEPGWVERVVKATGGSGPEVVFDGAGGDIGAEALRIVRHGGRFSAHGAPSGRFTTADPELVTERRLTVKGIEQAQLDPGNGRRVTALALAEAAAGRLRPLVGLTLPLEKAADAHAAIESRNTLGKTLLVV